MCFPQISCQGRPFPGRVVWGECHYNQSLNCLSFFFILVAIYGLQFFSCADEDSTKKRKVECIEKAEVQGTVGVRVGAEIIDVDADEDSTKKRKVERIEKTEVQGGADVQVDTGLTGRVWWQQPWLQSPRISKHVHELCWERYTVKNGVVHCTHHVTRYKQSTQSPKLHRDYPVNGLDVPMLNVD